MAHIQSKINDDGTTSYVVRWRDPNDVERSRSFSGPRPQVRARNYKSLIEASLIKGDYYDQRAGKITLKAYADEWLATCALAPATVDLRTRRMQQHVISDLGHLRLNAITPTVIKGWQKKIAEKPSRRGGTLATGTLKGIYGDLVTLMAAAYEDGLIPKNPMPARNSLPKNHKRRTQVVVPYSKVPEIIKALPERYRAIIRLMFDTGLRVGEATGLKLEDLNMLKRTITVSHSLSKVGGTHQLGPTKNRLTRTVTLPQSSVDALAAHLAKYGPSGDGYVFTNSSGRVLTAGNLRCWIWRPAMETMSLGMTLHDIRHSHVSNLLNARVPIADISKRIGHRNVLITYQVYSHMIPNDDVDPAIAALEAM